MDRTDGADKPWTVSGDQVPGEFVIHSLNNYTNVFLSSTAKAFDLETFEIEKVIHQLHDSATSELDRYGVRYADLRWALTPRMSHAEVALVFDSTATGSDYYGREISKAWLPALWTHGPKRTAISHGDLLGMPSSWVWRQLEMHLVRPGDFPHVATEQYFVVYLTNVSPTQTAALYAALHQSSPAHIGHVDCSTWIPLKTCMLLPQFAIRDREKLIVPADEVGIPHIRLPDTHSEFQLVGIEDTVYGVVLDHRIDNGVPEWADEDSALTLAALGGSGSPLHRLELNLDQRRFDHLTSDAAHGASFRRAGLRGLTRDELVRAIQAKVAVGLVFHLRFVRGTRDGEPAAENDALMFTVQVEFPDDTATVRRFQVGIKYRPADHLGEVVTFH